MKTKLTSELSLESKFPHFICLIRENRWFSSILYKGVYRNKPRGVQNMTPPLGARGGGQNLNCKFNTFGFLLLANFKGKNTVQLPFKNYLISLLNKTSRKKQLTNFFSSSLFSFSVITLSSSVDIEINALSTELET